MKKGFLLSIVVSSFLFANNIESGYDDYFVTDTNGSSYAWGYNYYGDLGVGDTNDKDTPTLLDTNVTFKDISSLYYHALGVTKDGQVYAWGYNSDGELGNGTTNNTSSPVKIDINDTIVQASAGGKFSLALSKNGQVYAWGYNSDGELGDGNTTDKDSPEKININDTIIQISAGRYHSLALSKDGQVYAWGYNGYGELGDGTDDNKDSPEQIDINDTIIQISAGRYHSLALSKDGKIYAWGYNNDGELGDGTTTDKDSPEQIDINDTIIKVSAGGYHSLALSQDGQVYVWGNNAYGELGDGTTTDKHIPVKIKFPSKIVDIDAGGESSIAIDENGWVYAWGYYAYNGNTVYTPKKIMNINPVNKVMENKRFVFFDNPNEDENNQYIAIVNIDQNETVSMKEYYLDGTPKVSFESNLTALDNKKAYFTAGYNKYWLVLNGTQIKLYKTKSNQNFMTDNEINFKETSLKDADIVKNYGYRLHPLDTDIKVDTDVVFNICKEDNNLTLVEGINGKPEVEIYDITNPYIPELKKSLSAKINSDLIDSAFYIYKAIKKGNSIYVTGYFYGYANEIDKTNSENENYYVYIAKFDITSNGLTQSSLKVLDRNDYSNFKLTNDKNYIYLMASVYNSKGDTKERLYVFDDNLNEKTYKDLSGYSSYYKGNLIAKDNKLFVAYDGGNGGRIIDVIDINNITETSISTEYNGHNMLKDNNNSVYLQTSYKLLKLDDNGKIKNKYSLKNVKKIYNNLALAYNNEYQLYRLNDDNTTTLLSQTDSLSGDFGNITFIDNNKFFGYDSDTKKIQLGGIKAYDKDFDGVYDYEDAYPNDPLRFFVDNDKDGLIDTLNPNTSFDSPIYKGYQFDPDYFNMEVSINNPVIIGDVKSGEYYSEDTTNTTLNVTLEQNGTSYSLNNSFVNLSVLNSGLDTDNYYNSSNDILAYYNNELYPLKDSTAILQVNTAKLPGKDYINNYVLLNTNSASKVSDTAKELNVSQEINENTTYQGDIYYDEDVKNSDYSWFKIAKTSNDSASSYTKYKFILNKQKAITDKNATVTIEFYKDRGLDFTVLSGDFVYKNKDGSYSYVDEEGNSYSVSQNSKGDYYYDYYYDSDKGEYVYNYIDNIDSKLLKEGYYSYGDYQYYVDESGIIYSLYFDDSKGQYYYYDGNKYVYITPELEAIGEKNYKISNLIMLDFVVDKTKNYYFKLKVNKDVSDYKFDLALIKDSSYYNGEINLDNNGTAHIDLVIPNSKTYKLILNGDNKFDANLTDYQDGNRVKEILTDGIYSYKKDLGLKAGLYSIYLKGDKNSTVRYMILDSDKISEQEPDNTIDQATKYIPGKEVQGTIANAADVDFYSFSLGNGYWDSNNNTYSFNITLNSKDVNTSSDNYLSIYLYNTTDPLAIASKKVYFSDFKNGSEEVTFDGNFPAGVYYIKLKYKNGNTYPLNYSLSLSNGYIYEVPNNNKEQLYTEQYYKYIANNTLDLDKINEINAKKGDSGEAIILAGIGDEPTDNLFKPTQILAYNMYKLFKYRGFSDKDITFMDSDTDANGDGVKDDFNDNSKVSVKAFYKAITDAESSKKEGPLYIYMVDHGANGAFKISSNDVDGDGNPEIVYAKTLADKLDDFQKATGRKVVLIIEACKSGSFINALKKSTLYERVVVTSSKANEISFIDPIGVSFTKFLQSNLLAGRDIETAYKFAKTELYKANPLYKNQHPEYYESNNLDSITIGGDFAAAGMELTKITGYYGDDNSTTVDLSSTNTLSLYAEVRSATPVKEVWATVIPPNYKPKVSDVNFSTPDLSDYTVKLTYNKNKNRYEGSFDLTNYKYNGLFKISYNVEDSDGNIISTSSEINATGGKDVPKETAATVDNTTQVSNNADTSEILHLKTGWNMVGALDSFYISNVSNYKDNYSKLFNSSNILVWKYTNGEWSLYTNNPNIDYGSIPQLSSLNKGDGFWVKINQNIDLNVSGFNSDEAIVSSVNTGWTLAGIMKDENSSELIDNTNAQIIWQYDSTTNKWMVYSEDADLKATLKAYFDNGTFEKLINLKKGSSCWIYLQ